MQGQPQWILTLLARELKAEYLTAVTELLSNAQLNIATITRLSGRKSLFNRSGRLRSIPTPPHSPWLKHVPIDTVFYPHMRLTNVSICQGQIFMFGT